MWFLSWSRMVRSRTTITPGPLSLSARPGRARGHLVAAFFLGLEEGAVRLPDDLRGRVGGFGIELRDTDRNGDVQRGPALGAGETEGLHPLAQPLGDHEGALHVHRGQNHREL